MENFLSRWFFDWLTVTIPNQIDGKGEKSAGEQGEDQEAEAVARMMSLATHCDLRKLRIGKGSDNYLGACHFAFDPTDSERLMTVRAGHARNMPGLEIPGGRGACADLSLCALSFLGPVMLARADVSLDVKREGLFDELHALCNEFAETRQRMEPPTLRGEETGGRTCYFGGKSASVKIYEKGKERVARGTAEPGTDDADPDLVRIEFTLRGEKAKQKHGLGQIARESGPGALLGTVCWIRHFVERLAVIVGDADEESAVVAVQRIGGRPDPRPVEARAAHGRSQYCGTFIAEAAKSFVREQCGHDNEANEWLYHDWRNVEVRPEQLVARAVEIIQPMLNVHAERFCRNHRFGWLQSREEEQESLHFDLQQWLIEFRSEIQGAQERLRVAEEQARARAGAVQPEPQKPQEATVRAAEAEPA